MKIGKIVGNFGVIGHFLLGQPISQVLFRIQCSPRAFGPIVIVHNEKDKQAPVYIILQTGYKFCFDPVYQRLESIEVYIDQDQKSKYMRPDLLIGPQNEVIGGNAGVVISNEISVYQSVSFRDVQSLYGASLQPKIRDNKVLLAFPGINFLFEYENQVTQEKLHVYKNRLVKIAIFDEEIRASRASEAHKLYPQIDMAPANRTISEHLRFKKCIVYPNKGIMFTAENDSFEMGKKIMFGMPLMEVL